MAGTRIYILAMLLPIGLWACGGGDKTSSIAGSASGSAGDSHASSGSTAQDGSSSSGSVSSSGTTGGSTGSSSSGTTVDAGSTDTGGATAGNGDATTGVACARDSLKATINAYFQALAAHDPTPLAVDPSVKFTENAKALTLGQGLWQTAGKVQFHRDVLDTERCGTVTEA